MVLGWAFVRSALDSLDPEHSSTVIFGVGGIFVIWAFGMAVGVAIMLIWNLRAPAYFRNETFAQGWIGEHAPDIAGDLLQEG